VVVQSLDREQLWRLPAIAGAIFLHQIVLILNYAERVLWGNDPEGRKKRMNLALM
jgi:hypothetical protein